MKKMMGQMLVSLISLILVFLMPILVVQSPLLLLPLLGIYLYSRKTPAQRVIYKKKWGKHLKNNSLYQRVTGAFGTILFGIIGGGIVQLLVILNLIDRYDLSYVIYWLSSIMILLIVGNIFNMMSYRQMYELDMRSFQPDISRLEEDLEKGPAVYVLEGDRIVGIHRG